MRSDQHPAMRSIFHFNCYGESNISTKLHLVDGKVNKQIGQVCSDRKARIAFWNSPGYFEIHAITKEPFTNENYKFIKTLNGPLAIDILSPFLAAHKLTPIYQDNAEHVPGVSKEEIQSFPPSAGQVIGFE